MSETLEAAAPPETTEVTDSKPTPLPCHYPACRIVINGVESCDEGLRRSVSRYR